MSWSNHRVHRPAAFHFSHSFPTTLFPSHTKQYWQFYVPREATELRFVLTPATLWGDEDLEDLEDIDFEAPDQDLFLSTSREREPGENSYDLMSSSWAGVDEIVFSQEEAGDAFCADCIIYLAVYGYAGAFGEYTLRVRA